LVAFEGSDKCGKTHHIKILKELFHCAKYLAFPNRNSESGIIIDKHLRGEINIDKERLHTLFAENRREMSHEIE
jgi:thymidylate kinase